MSVNARAASAQSETEIHIDSDDRPMSQDGEPNAGPDAEPDARAASAQSEAEIHSDSDDRPMSVLSYIFNIYNSVFFLLKKKDDRPMSQVAEPVNARAASAQSEAEIHSDSDDRPEIHSDSDDRPMSRVAEPAATPDIRRMSQQRQLTHSPNSRELRTWIGESEWTDYIKHRSPTFAVSIFRVPEFLKNTKKEAYVPRRVSLGPYHHGSAELPPMGHHKGRALCRMMKRFNISHRNLPVVPNNIDFGDRARAEILKLENEIRDSYEENIDCDGDTLARMLCLDGYFLLQVLTTLCGDTSLGTFLLMTGNIENEIIMFSSRDIVEDVLMLENQVPFIVLRKLLQLELNSTNDVDVDQLLFNMVMGCIWRLLNPYNYTFHKQQWCHIKLADEEEVQHLLGFLYEAIVLLGFGPIEDTDRGPIEDTDRGPVCSICIDCLGSCMDRGPVCSRCIECLCIMQHQDGMNKAPNHFQRIRPAVELRNAGIKFEPCHGSIKKIKFDPKSPTIFLPPICITDITEVLFRNLIAFEVCRPSQIKYVSCYVNIMDNLIDSQNDVALLRSMGVLTNWLGRDNEVVDLFNGLSKATAPVNQFHAFHRLMIEGVNAHYEKEIWVQRQLPKVVLDYCSTPWKALASAAAIALLMLALVQTIFSVIAVYK